MDVLRPAKSKQMLTVLNSVQVNVTFVGTEKERHQKYVMILSKMTLKDAV